uniref:Uncharacterized protein n=1 Tax=Talaromyces marneffei PM1 TaxID=1077442 RepID=A0A093UQK0_TALMA
MTTQQSSSQATEADIYKFISTYDFSSDLEFRKGLGTILGHPEQPASDAEVAGADDVVFQAKCFYISRKQNISPSIDFKNYKNWLREHDELNTTTETAAENSNTEDSNAAVATSSTQPTSAPPQEEKKEGKDVEPAYPPSFAHIVELITNNQPIPGIEEIPDTVLAGHDEPSKVTKRRKPWEKDVEVDVVGNDTQV